MSRIPHALKSISSCSLGRVPFVPRGLVWWCAGSPGSSEAMFYFKTGEQARNAGILWLEILGGYWGGDRLIKHGKGIGGSALKGREVGFVTCDGRSFRADWDPRIGAHFNVAMGKGGFRRKAVFRFDAPFSGKMGELWFKRTWSYEPRNPPGE